VESLRGTRHAYAVAFLVATSALLSVLAPRYLPPAHRHFGSATSRTRTADATPSIDVPEDRPREDPRSDRLTTEGSRNDARSSA